MSLRGRIVGAMLVAAAMVTLVAGCGGGGGSSASEPEANAAEFSDPGGENKIVKFGEEADEEEREAASDVLDENFKARAAGNWAEQCASLSARAINRLKGEAREQSVKESCAASLEYGAEPVVETKAIRANTMTGPVDVLLVKGNRAFALYHGTQGKDYAMPMVEEGGEWKVDALVTREP